MCIYIYINVYVPHVIRVRTPLSFFFFRRRSHTASSSSSSSLTTRAVSGQKYPDNRRGPQQNPGSSVHFFPSTFTRSRRRLFSRADIRTPFVRLFPTGRRVAPNKPSYYTRVRFAQRPLLRERHGYRRGCATNPAACPHTHATASGRIGGATSNGPKRPLDRAHKR